MSLLADLHYRYPRDSRPQRFVQAIASGRPGAWFFRKVAHRLDRVVFSWTGGRATVTSILAGKPVLMVTTRGARSGKDRTVPLLGIPLDGTIALVGSNFGQRPTPGWVHNLIAYPGATVSHGGREVRVRAHLASEEVAHRILEEGEKLYAGYGKYPSRVPHREIKVFILEHEHERE